METPQDQSGAGGIPASAQEPIAVAPAGTPPVQQSPNAVNSLAPPPSLPSEQPLGEADFSLVRQATTRHKAIRNASRTALSSAIVTLFIGATALPLTAFSPSWVGVLTAIGVCVIGVVEFIGYKRMRRADPTAAKFLGRNQLAFLALIIVYCVIQMVTFSTAGLKAELEGAMDKDIDRWAPMLTYAFYGLVIFLSIIFQGGLAIYYFTRRRHLEAFNSRTPPWVRRLFIETQS